MLAAAGGRRARGAGRRRRRASAAAGLERGRRRQRAGAARHRGPARPRTAPGLSGLVVTGALLSRDGSDRGDERRGPRRPRQILRLDTATLAWTRVTDGPPLPDAALVVPTLEFFSGARRAAADRLAVPAAGPDRARPGHAQPARRTRGAGAADLQPAAPGDGRRRHHRVRAEHPRLVGVRPGLRPRRRRPRPPGRLRRRARPRGTSWSTWASPSRTGSR